MTPLKLTIKKVRTFKTHELRNLLIFMKNVDISKKLPTEITKLKSDGLALEIIQMLYNLIDHTCTNCWQRVQKSRTEDPPKVTCICCGTKACMNCFGNISTAAYSFVCPPCSKRIVKIKRILDFFIKEKDKI